MWGECLAFMAPGPWEMMVIGLIALLLFGKRLPEVARSLGKGFVEFKKGVKGIEDEVEQASYDADVSSSAARPVPEDEQEETTAPKFEPPQSPPSESTAQHAEEKTTEASGS